MLVLFSGIAPQNNDIKYKKQAEKSSYLLQHELESVMDTVVHLHYLWMHSSRLLLLSTVDAPMKSNAEEIKKKYFHYFILLIRDIKIVYNSV